MHDTLNYFKNDPIHRRYHQNEVTFSLMYAFTENFMLPLSHDEVVHGKGALIERMPGDEWQKFANLRTLYAYMYTHPGSKLLFMGGEFGQTSEWSIVEGLAWWLTEHRFHKGMQQLVADLNALYKSNSALHELQFSNGGFEWLDQNDGGNSGISYMRKAKNGKYVVVVCNFTPVERQNYLVGAPEAGHFIEIFNSDHQKYGGSGSFNDTLQTTNIAWQGRPQSISVTLPPLGVVVLEKA